MSTEGPAATPLPPDRVEAVRAFNRFYTERIGVLAEGMVETPFPLPEARLLYELGRRGSTTATDLSAALDLDRGYLSRLLRRLERRELLARARSATDGRQSLLGLTSSGQAAYQALDAGSARQVATLLSSLSEADQARLVDSMSTIESLLRPPAQPRSPSCFDLHTPVTSAG